MGHYCAQTHAICKLPRVSIPVDQKEHAVLCRACWYMNPMREAGSSATILMSNLIAITYGCVMKLHTQHFQSVMEVIFLQRDE